MRATLQSAFQKLAVNREARIVTGIKLLENNRDVTFKGADGKPMGFRTNEALLSGLLAHAGNRTIPCHLSHEWTNGKTDGLHDRVGGIKNARLSENGDLIGDYHAMPGEKGDSILWLAENDPEHAMLSLVFDYNPIKTDSVTYAVPLNFTSADFVAQGAGVSAMLSKTQTDTDMTETEFDNMLAKSPAFQKALGDYITGILAKYVTKEDADKLVTAALAGYKLPDDQQKSIAILAQSKVIEGVGKTAFVVSAGADPTADEYTAKLAEYSKTAPNPATAVARMLKDHPHLSVARENAIRAQLSNK